MAQPEIKGNVLVFPGTIEDDGAAFVKADTDEGYTRIANALLESVYCCDLTGRQSRVLLAVIRKTYGFNRKTDWLSAPLIANSINYSGDDSNVRKDIKILKDRKILICDGRKVGPNPIISEWEMCKQVENNTGRKQPGNRLKTTCKQVENNLVNRLKTTCTKDTIKDNKKERNIKDKGVVYPDWLNVELFKEFVKFRKLIKKPMTDKAQQLAIRKLDNLRADGSCPDAIIEQSIENGWQSFYPLKSPSKRAVQGDSNQSNAMSWLEKKMQEGANHDA